MIKIVKKYYNSVYHIYTKKSNGVYVTLCQHNVAMPLKDMEPFNEHEGRDSASLLKYDMCYKCYKKHTNK